MSVIESQRDVFRAYQQVGARINRQLASLSGYPSVIEVPYHNQHDPVACTMHERGLRQIYRLHTYCTRHRTFVFVIEGALSPLPAPTAARRT